MKTFAQLREETSARGAADHEKRVKKIEKGSKVSFTHAMTGKKVTGTFKGIKRMGAHSYAHVEHKDGGTYVPFHEIHEAVE